MRILALALLLAVTVAAKDAPLVPVNINAATIAQLKTLPGVGDTMAAAIVRYREKNGPFRRVEDLLIIRGISKKRLASWRPYIKLK